MRSIIHDPSRDRRFQTFPAGCCTAHPLTILTYPSVDDPFCFRSEFQMFATLKTIWQTLTMMVNGETTALRSGEVSRVQQQSPVKLDIIVVGAGISGLASAISAALSGHNVTVFESAKELLEVSQNRTYAMFFFSFLPRARAQSLPSVPIQANKELTHVGLVDRSVLVFR